MTLFIGCTNSSTTSRPDSLGVPDGGGVSDGAVQDAAVIPGALAVRLDAATATWATAKIRCAAYRYDRVLSSVFRSRATTTVEIVGDQPTRRAFVYYIYGTFPPVDGAAPTEQWEERGTDIGSHPNGFPALAVEGLLAECRTILSRDPVANTLSLDVNAEGVPTSCTFTIVSCIDDCTRGISIPDFVCQ